MSFAANKRTFFSVHDAIEVSNCRKKQGVKFIRSVFTYFREIHLSVMDFWFGLLRCYNFIIVVISLFVAVLASPFADSNSSHPTSSISDSRKRSTINSFGNLLLPLLFFH